MDYKVFLTELAQTDLDEIISYISNVLYNPKAAQKLLNLFVEQTVFLETSPYMYPECNDKYLAEKGYRKLIFNNYIALYKVCDDKKEVQITRIVYAKRDYSHLV